MFIETEVVEIIEKVGEYQVKLALLGNSAIIDANEHYILLQSVPGRYNLGDKLRVDFQYNGGYVQEGRS
jgi:hypothetical protein